MGCLLKKSFHVVLCVSTAYRRVSLETFFWMVTSQGKRELCAAERKWAFTLETLGVSDQNKGGVAKREKSGPPRGATIV